MAREKIVIRLLPELYEVLERYAAWSDKKVAALISEILHEQCEAARRAGEKVQQKSALTLSSVRALC